MELTDKDCCNVSLDGADRSSRKNRGSAETGKWSGSTIQYRQKPWMWNLLRPSQG